MCACCHQNLGSFSGASPKPMWQWRRGLECGDRRTSPEVHLSDLCPENLPPTLREKKLKKQFPLSLTQFSGPPPAFGRHAAVRHGALQSHKATSPAPAEHRTTSLISGNVLPCTDFFFESLDVALRFFA